MVNSKYLFILLATSLVLFLSACGGSGKKTGISSDGNSKFNVNTGVQGDNLSLPEGYPEDLLPLTKDAKIIGVIHKTANNPNTSISYVTDVDIGTLSKLYAEIFREGGSSQINEIDSGHFIVGEKDNMVVSITISEGIMDHLPGYKGKKSVLIDYRVAEVLETIPEVTGEGQPWPQDDLPGLPELKGDIENFFKDENTSHLTIRVEGTEIVEDYIGVLRENDIDFWDEPVMDDGRIEFLSSINGNTLNFSYKESEKRVFIEYLLN